MKIHALIIRKDRSIHEEMVNAGASKFTFNRGLYTIPREAVNLVKWNGKEDVYPELIYMEGDPLPVNVVEGSAQQFLEHTVLENALKQTAEPKGWILDLFLDYMKNPPKLFLLMIIIIIAASVIGGFLLG